MPDNKQESVENFVFDKQQMKKVLSFVNKNDKSGLDKYLTSIAPELKKRGFDSKYVYYQLCYIYDLD
jgi:hypothetical protein